MLEKVNPLSSAVKQTSVKLMLRWSEPLVIAEFLSPVTVQIVNPVTGEKGSYFSTEKGARACFRPLPLLLLGVPLWLSARDVASETARERHTQTPFPLTMGGDRYCIYCIYIVKIVFIVYMWTSLSIYCIAGQINIEILLISLGLILCKCCCVQYDGELISSIMVL
jgi:hypothetical protein